MGWVDLLLASYLASGAIAALTYTMVLYLLPVGLFGVSVAAAELPDMSEVTVHDPETRRRRFRMRLEDSMARIAWYVAFTATMFIVVGDVIVAAVFERGAFDRGDTVVVWMALAFLSMGLLPVAATLAAERALRPRRRPHPGPARSPGRRAVGRDRCVHHVPARPAGRRARRHRGLGRRLAFGPLPDLVRANPAEIPHLGIVGLAIGARISDWIEYRLLSTALAWRIGRTKIAGRWLGQISVGCAWPRRGVLRRDGVLVAAERAAGDLVVGPGRASPTSA